MLLVRLMLLLESRDQDRFASTLYPVYQGISGGPRRRGKGGKPIERCVISSFEVAKSPGLTSEVSPTGAPPLGDYSVRLELENLPGKRVRGSLCQPFLRQAPKVVLVMRGLQIG